MTVKLLREQIKIILNQMNFLGWTWKLGTKDRIPTSKELKIAATHCMRQAWLSDDNFYNSGGFECEVINNTIELRFIIERVNPLSILLG